MKINFLIDTLGGGGAERVLIDLVSALSKAGEECVITTVTGGTYGNNIPPFVKHRQIVKDGLLSKILSRAVFHLPKKLFCKLFLREDCDIFVAYLEGFMTRALAQKKCKHKLAFIHCDLSVSPVIEKYYQTKEKCLEEYKKFDRVCVVSQKLKDSFVSLFGDECECTVVHNVLNTEKIKIKSLESPPVRFSGEKPKLISVGRLVEAKNFEMMFDTAKRLETKHGFELIVVGDGELRPKLEKYIAENNISSVKMPGFFENPYPILKQADLFLCSSVYEGYSTAVTEAVLLGVPVLTTDCAGMSEILENGKFGWIVKTAAEFEAQLDLLLSNPDLIKAKAATIKENAVISGNDKNLDAYLRLFGEVNGDK